MAITQRTTIDPNAMATNWAARVAQSGAKWVAGIKSPRRLPNADPTGNAAKWTAGVAAAEPKLVAALQAPTYLTNLEAGATNKQGSYTGAGQAKKANAAAGFQKV